MSKVSSLQQIKKNAEESSSLCDQSKHTAVLSYSIFGEIDLTTLRYTQVDFLYHLIIPQVLGGVVKDDFSSLHYIASRSNT
jgi:hypothetical protein